MKTKHVNRLRQLYAMLDGIPNARFDLNDWRQMNEDGADAYDQLDVDEHFIHDCDTTGCAVGWACSYPIFTEQGLEFKNGTPYFKGDFNWPAVQNFFGLSFEQAHILFSGGSSTTHAGAEGRRLVRNKILDLLYAEGAITASRAAELRE